MLSTSAFLNILTASLSRLSRSIVSGVFEKPIVASDLVEDGAAAGLELAPQVAVGEYAGDRTLRVDERDEAEARLRHLHHRGGQRLARLADGIRLRG